MLSVLFTILPVFLILGAGYVAGRTGYLPDSIADGLNQYAVKFAVPILLFWAMYRLDLGAAFNVPMLVSFYAGAFFCFYTAMFVSRAFWRRRADESVAVGFCAVFSNTVLIGIPIAQLAFGGAVLTPVFGVIALHASLLYAVGMMSMEFSRSDGQSLSQTAKAALRTILANPLMIGILAGLVYNLSGFSLFAPLESAIGMVRDSAIPVALVGIGIALNRYTITDRLSETLMVSILALIVHRAIAYVLSHYLFALEPQYVRAAVVLAAMPPGMNIYIFAALYNRAMNLSASVLVIANILAVLTIPLWLVLLQTL